MSDAAVRPAPSLDDVLALLSSRYRRRLLVSLLERDRGDDPRVPVDAPIEGEERDAQEIRASHSHLPKLESAGVVEWDRASGDVGRGPNFDDVEPVLEGLRDNVDELPGDWL